MHLMNDSGPDCMIENTGLLETIMLQRPLWYGRSTHTDQVNHLVVLPINCSIRFTEIDF